MVHEVLRQEGIQGKVRVFRTLRRILQLSPNRDDAILNYLCSERVEVLLQDELSQVELAFRRAAVMMGLEGNGGQRAQLGKEIARVLRDRDRSIAGTDIVLTLRGMDSGRHSDVIRDVFSEYVIPMRPEDLMDNEPVLDFIVKVAGTLDGEDPWTDEEASEGTPAGLEEEVERYNGLTRQGTGALAPDRWIQAGLVQSGQRRGVVGLPAAAGLEGIRVFLHPELPGKDFAGLEEVRLPGEAGRARAFLQEVGVRESDVILLPLSVAAGLEQGWRPDGSRTPIVVTSAGGLEEATPQELGALALLAKRLEGQVLRVGLEEWEQRMVSEERLSLQY